MRRGWLALLACLLASCAVDTELGLDATIDAASVTVAPDDSVSVRLDLTYRVGEHAAGPRGFQPQAIELYVEGDPVAALVPMAPPGGLTSTVAPGESYSTTLTGVTDTADTPRRLCGAQVRVLFRWLDRTASEIGMTEAIASDVTCS